MVIEIKNRIASHSGEFYSPKKHFSLTYNQEKYSCPENNEGFCGFNGKRCLYNFSGFNGECEVIDEFRDSNLESIKERIERIFTLFKKNQDN